MLPQQIEFRSRSENLAVFYITNNLQKCETVLFFSPKLIYFGKDIFQRILFMLTSLDYCCLKMNKHKIIRK